MDQRGDVRGAAPGVVQQRDDALLDGLRRLLRRRQELADADRAGVLVDQDEVGERAADVDADARATGSLGCHGGECTECPEGAQERGAR